MKYSVELIETEAGFEATCPALPGVTARGYTREEALENITAAIQRRIDEDTDDGSHSKHDHGLF